jgi:hypothetical protein
MTDVPPAVLVTLANDEDAARYVGRTADGRQFFLTTPFVPATDPESRSGREFLALYTFDASGRLLEAAIDDLGPRADLHETAHVARRDALLQSLGAHRFCPIRITPFVVRRFGVDFGFILQSPSEDGDEECIVVEPGNYMCFWPPYEDGEYDT